MEVPCPHCVKLFPDRARLNFHVKRAHSSTSSKEDENGHGRQFVSSSGKTVEVEKKACRRILKFAKIPGTTDYTVKPFRVSQVTLKITNPQLYDEVTAKKKRKEEIPSDLEDSASVISVPISVDLPALPAKKADDDPEMPLLSPQISPSGIKTSTKRSRVSASTCDSSSSEIAFVDLVDDDDGEVKPLPCDSTFPVPCPSVSSSTTSSRRKRKEKENYARNSDGMETDCSETSTLSDTEGQQRKRGRPPNGSGRQPIECPVCGETSFRSNRHYQNHLEVHEGKKPYLCPTCNMGYETEMKLLEHVSIYHFKEAAFNCIDCGVEYKTERGLLGHKCK